MNCTEGLHCSLFKLPQTSQEQIAKQHFSPFSFSLRQGRMLVYTLYLRSLQYSYDRPFFTVLPLQHLQPWTAKTAAYSLLKIFITLMPLYSGNNEVSIYGGSFHWIKGVQTFLKISEDKFLSKVSKFWIKFSIISIYSCLSITLSPYCARDFISSLEQADSPRYHMNNSWNSAYWGKTILAKTHVIALCHDQHLQQILPSRVQCIVGASLWMQTIVPHCLQIREVLHWRGQLCLQIPLLQSSKKVCWDW